MTIFLFISAVWLICFYGTSRVDIKFSDELMQEFEEEFAKTPYNHEFVGNLYVKNDYAIRYEFVGYKVLPTWTTTGNAVLINVPKEESDISIHSHPGGSSPWACWISPFDKLGLEKIECIYCNKEVKCYEI